MNDDESNHSVTHSCAAVPGMVSPLNANPDHLRPVVERVADLALNEGTTVTLTGWLPPDLGVICQSDCRYSHWGSIVVIPDVVLIELMANHNQDIPATDTMRRADGRTCHLYGVTHAPLAT